MSGQRSTTRRQLIAGGLGLFGLATSAALFERVRLTQSICDHFNAGGRNGADARIRIGAFFLRQHRHEASIAHLETALMSSLQTGLDDPSGRSGDLLAHIDERIRQDYAEEQTFILDGWLLSQTELRLCALECLYAKA